MCPFAATPGRGTKPPNPMDLHRLVLSLSRERCGEGPDAENEDEAGGPNLVAGYSGTRGDRRQPPSRACEKVARERDGGVVGEAVRVAVSK